MELFLLIREVIVSTVIGDEFDFVGRVGVLHIIFNKAIDDQFVGFVSRGEMVLVENLICEAIGGGD